MTSLYVEFNNKQNLHCQRNINNLRYTDDTTLMAENKEELTSLLMKGKEDSEKVGLKHNIQKKKNWKKKKKPQHSEN